MLSPLPAPVGAAGHRAPTQRPPRAALLDTHVSDEQRLPQPESPTVEEELQPFVRMSRYISRMLNA